MPHAEKKSTMSQTQVLTNGDHKSQTLEHLKQYPIVTDGIDQFKANSLGAKSIEIADATYNRVGKPLEPHLRTPYSYVRPYVNKADSLADQALSTVDNRFPIVKEDTNTIFGTVKNLAYWPFAVANDGKNYVFNTFDTEYKRTLDRPGRRPGVVTFSMAVISTEMSIASDALQLAADWLGPKKNEAKAKKDDLVSQAKSKTDKYAQKADSYAQKAKESTE